MQWTSYDKVRVYFELIVKVWIQIRRAILSWVRLGIAFANLIPLTLVRENKTHGQQISNNSSILPYSRRQREKLPICGVSARFNSHWSLAPNSNHWERSDLLESQLSLVFKRWSKWPQNNKQSNPLLGFTIKPTSTINYQISPYAKVRSTPNPKRLLTTHTINIFCNDNKSKHDDQATEFKQKHNITQ